MRPEPLRESRRLRARAVCPQPATALNRAGGGSRRALPRRLEASHLAAELTTHAALARPGCLARCLAPAQGAPTRPASAHEQLRAGQGLSAFPAPPALLPAALIRRAGSAITSRSTRGQPTLPQSLALSSVPKLRIPRPCPKSLQGACLRLAERRLSAAPGLTPRDGQRQPAALPAQHSGATLGTAAPGAARAPLAILLPDAWRNLPHLMSSCIVRA